MYKAIKLEFQTELHTTRTLWYEHTGTQNSCWHKHICFNL